MTTVNMIPKELEEYVWFESADTLTHSEDMPETLLELFEQTKSAILKVSLEKKNALKNLLK